MSKFNLKGANINATNLHIGDVYNYSSSSDFISKNANLEFTKTEKELVKIIFENTSSEEERQQILDSLKATKEEPQSKIKRNSHLELINKYYEKVKQIGWSVTEKVVAVYLADQIKNA